MPIINQRELEKIKNRQGVYQTLTSNDVNSIIMKHIFRLIKIAFNEYNPNEKDWKKFEEILKRTL